MKKLLYAFGVVAALGLSSCLPQFGNSVYYTDYRPVTSTGFFVTESNSVSFPYEAVGSMTLKQKNGYVKSSAKKDKTVTGYDDVFMDKHPEKQKKQEEKQPDYKYATAEGALEDFAAEARKRGADGVINCKTLYIFSKDNVFQGVEISGMLIKRK